MDIPTSNGIISSEFNVDSQPDQPAETITFMDAALYEAAAGGKTEEFNNYQGFALESLRTQNLNTVLHVYLEAKEPSDNNCVSETSFIKQIVNKCYSLLRQPNAKGQTALHIAARYGYSAIVKFLINHAKAPHGDIENPGMDQLEAVREILRMPDLESNTALHVAVQYGHVQVVQALLEFEDPDFPYSVNRNQESPLYIAARRGDGALLTMILDKLRSTAEGGPHGRTALHAAAMAGDADATRIILEKKGNLTLQTDENGQTPLHYAAHLGHSSVVKELLKRGKCAAYIADKNSEMTPLLMAARQGYEQIVKEIISCCPNCCGKMDKRGWNLLHFVAVRDSPFRFLKSYGETEYRSIRKLRNEKDVHGITPAQVYDAFLSRSTIALDRDSFKKLVWKREQIMKLLGDIVNEVVAEAPIHPIRLRKASEDSNEKAREANLVVAALIATVTFTAAITVPGGYKSEKGPEQGTPFLIHDAAFIIFVVSNALAFICSIVAIAFHFEMALPFLSNGLDTSVPFELAAGYIGYALWAIGIAFGTGTFAVLKPSLGLAIPVLCFGLFISILIWLRMALVFVRSVFF